MKKLLVVLLLALFALAGCTPAQSPAKDGEAPAPVEAADAAEDVPTPAEAPTYRRISEQEAIPLLAESEGYILLDVRTPSEFAEKHIPGAINVPNENIGSDPVPELPDKDQHVFIYCRSGNRSKQAAEKLVQLGYTNIIEFGGIINWTGETVSGEE